MQILMCTLHICIMHNACVYTVSTVKSYPAHSDIQKLLIVECKTPRYLDGISKLKNICK